MNSVQWLPNGSWDRQAAHPKDAKITTVPAQRRRCGFQRVQREMRSPLDTCTLWMLAMERAMIWRDRSASGGGGGHCRHTGSNVRISEYTLSANIEAKKHATSLADQTKRVGGALTHRGDIRGGKYDLNKYVQARGNERQQGTSTHVEHTRSL